MHANCRLQQRQPSSLIVFLQLRDQTSPVPPLHVRGLQNKKFPRTLGTLVPIRLRAVDEVADRFSGEGSSLSRHGTERIKLSDSTFARARKDSNTL